MNIKTPLVVAILGLSPLTSAANTIVTFDTPATPITLSLAPGAPPDVVPLNGVPGGEALLIAQNLPGNNAASLLTGDVGGGSANLLFTGGSPGDLAVAGVIIDFDAPHDFPDGFFVQVGLNEPLLNTTLQVVAIDENSQPVASFDLQPGAIALIQRGQVNFAVNKVDNIQVNGLMISQSDARLSMDILEVHAIPEPSTMLLAIVGLIPLATLRRRV